MSVIVMLAVLWWGLCGFLAFLAGLWGFLEAIGQKGRFVFFILVGLLGQHLIVRHLTSDERCANDFLTAWQAESADFPEGRVNTREISEFLDCERLGSVNPYLAEHWRLRYHSPVRVVGKEDVDAKGSASPVPAKAFIADVRFHGSEHDVDFSARIRIWIARDTHKVARFMLEDIRFH